MKIIILGAGAIGSFYGAKLSDSNEVVLIGRKNHVDKINKDGLTIIGKENKNYNLNALTEIKEIGEEDIIILSTKIIGNKETIEKIKDNISMSNTIICMQNGYQPEEDVKEIIKDKCLVLRGITSYGISFLNPGIISLNNPGKTIIEKSKKSKMISKIFDSCELKCSVSENIKKDVWEKLIMNCVMNPVTAILQVENGKMASKELDFLKKNIIDECLDVAKKDGVNFDFNFLQMLNERVKESKNISSMRQDLLKGRKTEIDFFNGRVVSLGKKYGIDCKVNESMVSMIKFLENNPKTNI